MQGTVHVTGSGLDRDIDLHADAVVEPGPGPAEVILKIAAQDHDCRLVARRDAGGALAFAPGQSCAIDVRSPDTTGHVEATLTSGSGRIREEGLSLALAARISGALTVGAGPPLVVLGQTVPGTGGTQIPVKGEARATAEGRRDRSRAAER